MENEWVWRDKGWRQGLLLGDFQWSTSERERDKDRASLIEGRCYEDRERGEMIVKVKLASCVLAFMWVISFTLFQILIK